MSEAALQRACRAYATRQGARFVKLGGYEAGLPDTMFLLPRGRMWLVEFKTPEGRLSKRQDWTFAALEAMGHTVSVIRSTVEFRLELRRRLTL